MGINLWNWLILKRIKRLKIGVNKNFDISTYKLDEDRIDHNINYQKTFRELAD